MGIKDILKNRRNELNLTMKELSAKVGVSEGTISRWESGEIANMKRDKIIALADALQISPAVIMGWDDDKVSQSNVSSPSRSEPQEDQKRLLEHYDKLNPTGKEKVIEYTEDLTSNPKYTQDTALKNA